MDEGVGIRENPWGTKGWKLSDWFLKRVRWEGKQIWEEEEYKVKMKKAKMAKMEEEEKEEAKEKGGGGWGACEDGGGGGEV